MFCSELNEKKGNDKKGKKSNQNGIIAKDIKNIHIRNDCNNDKKKCQIESRPKCVRIGFFKFHPIKTTYLDPLKQIYNQLLLLF